MPTNMTNDAGAAAPAFVLRDLKSSDVWQLVRVLRRFNLREARKLIDQDTLKKAKFERPMKLVDGELVPMPQDEWTAAQRYKIDPGHQVQMPDITPPVCRHTCCRNLAKPVYLPHKS